MKISFVVIAYNEERNIANTLRAIVAQQDMPSYEVVVVNDGSRDDTLGAIAAVARDHKQIRVVDLQPNRGRGAARAAGVEAAKGDYLAFVDADIVLPPHWLSACMPYMKDYDACGGTAVPDGDVAWVHRVFDLQPKVAPHTTTVTGSNGLFCRSVFDVVSFNPDKKNGEDVALGYQIAAAKLKTITVPGLLVDHHETKTYRESLAWLFESGIGASRQFYEHKQVRMPDIAFAGFAGLTLLTGLNAIVATRFWFVPAIMLFGYTMLSSAAHMHGKFVLAATPLRSAGALLGNATLLVAYYCGRAVGFAKEWK